MKEGRISFPRSTRWAVVSERVLTASLTEFAQRVPWARITPLWMLQGLPLPPHWTLPSSPRCERFLTILLLNLCRKSGLVASSMLNYALSTRERKSVARNNKSNKNKNDKRNLYSSKTYWNSFAGFAWRQSPLLPKAKVAISCRVAWENLPQSWPAEQKDWLFFQPWVLSSQEKFIYRRNDVSCCILNVLAAWDKNMGALSSAICFLWQ